MILQLQCVGCDRKFYWPFGGTLVALSGTEWSLLGLLVFELVALVLRVAVLPLPKARQPSVAMNSIRSLDVGTAPVSAGGTP